MRHTGHTKPQSASVSPFVLDALESRRLLADASGIVVIEWHGQQIEMRQGEWIVALTRPGDTFNEETGRWKSNAIHNRGTTPSESLQPAIEAAEEMGIEFRKYLGSEDAFLVKIPDGMGYSQLLDVMNDLPEFRYVEPNGVMRSGAMPFLPDVSPEEAGSEELIADKPDVIEQPAKMRFAMPPQTAFSQTRVGGSDVLDGEDDDEDELLK